LLEAVDSVLAAVELLKLSTFVFVSAANATLFTVKPNNATRVNTLFIINLLFG
jgi:hypothetical protein